MMPSPKELPWPQGVMRALRHDRAGNTLVMMAMAMIPMTAIAGAAIDTASTYVVKVRLQQACDAGALAGRKFLDDKVGHPMNEQAQTQAAAFFANNFRNGFFRADTARFVPTRTATNQVAATASVTVPMTITRIIGGTEVNLVASCEARYDTPDADVMFVLDTTGSMAWAAGDTNLTGQPYRSYTLNGETRYYVEEKSNARIKALRTAVLNFYDTVKLNADPAVQIRYGIVPYSSTVNVGRQLPSAMLQRGTVNYQSRYFLVDVNIDRTTSDKIANVSQNNCNGRAGRFPGTGYDADTRAQVRTVSWVADSSGSNGECTVTRQTQVPAFRYTQLPTDVSRYVTGVEVPVPTDVQGARSRWNGCVEATTTSLASFDQDNLPADLDPDSSAPVWQPQWADVVYDRFGYETLNYYDRDSFGQYTGSSYSQAVCPKEVMRLKKIDRREDLSSYLNASDFRPVGGTYHDVGMIWGSRLISPRGPFALDTRAGAGREEPTRHIVFMTDGEMAPSLDVNGMYGVERYDRRVANGQSSILAERHNARFLAVCEAARARNITVWVVAFGARLDDNLRRCASAGRAFEATNDAQLNAAFRSIAEQVAFLRLER